MPAEPPAGVHPLELPLPFSPRSIWVFLVPRPDGWLLIDCGIDTPECLEALAGGLARLGIQWPEIRELLLTHYHPDHVGLAPEVLGRSGARLLMHPADVETLRQITDRERHIRWHRSALEQAGAPPELVEQVLAAFAENEKSFYPLEPDRLLEDGARVDTSLGPLEVLWTPGHSPGHVCLYWRELRTLFSGDHVLPGISPNIGWHPGRESLAEYLESLERVARLEVELILPSHGAPFSGLGPWVEKTRQHHELRCREIARALERGGRTPHELAGALWDRPLTPFYYRFAVFEVMAHLEYMGRLQDGGSKNAGFSRNFHFGSRYENSIHPLRLPASLRGRLISPFRSPLLTRSPLPARRCAVPCSRTAAVSDGFRPTSASSSGRV